MRPKKVILYASNNEQDLSTVGFMLKVHGYQVLTAMGSAETIDLFTANCPDLVLVDFPIAQATVTIDRLKAIHPYVPLVLIGDPQPSPGWVSSADFILRRRGLTTAEFLDCIRAMSARKRGPRKGSPVAFRNMETARAARTA